MDKNNLQAGIWIIGIGILGWLDFWWPGILFLIGIGTIAQAILPNRKQETPPDKLDEAWLEPSTNSQSSNEFPEKTPEANSPFSSSPPPPAAARSWLPTRCPACGAPLTPNEANWLASDRAECPYCHTILSPQ